MLCYFAHLSVFSHSIFCFWSFTRFFVWLHCQREHTVFFFVCSTKQKSLLMKCAPEHALSVLKPNSFVLKWKRVVSVLSPLSLFSHGGSHIIGDFRHDFKCLKGNNLTWSAFPACYSQCVAMVTNTTTFVGTGVSRKNRFVLYNIHGIQATAFRSN